MTTHATNITKKKKKRESEKERIHSTRIAANVRGIFVCTYCGLVASSFPAEALGPAVASGAKENYRHISAILSVGYLCDARTMDAKFR